MSRIYVERVPDATRDAAYYALKRSRLPQIENWIGQQYLNPINAIAQARFLRRQCKQTITGTCYSYLSPVQLFHATTNKLCLEQDFSKPNIDLDDIVLFVCLVGAFSIAKLTDVQMPFLHYETDSSRAAMGRTIK